MFDLTQAFVEDKTLDIALSGRSISRVGEGELRLVVRRWNLKSQPYDFKLAREVSKIMAEPSKALICLPRLWSQMPMEKFWRQFKNAEYTDHFHLKEYGSAFISRPDVANHIDRPDYWQKVRKLWQAKDVTLASHGMVLKMPDAASVRLVKTPPIGAYRDIDRIEEEIGNPSGPVFLCIGITATVLAVRLANKGIFALDVGHLGHFMPHIGAFSVNRDDLISPEYVKQNIELHRRPEGYGGSGRKWAAIVMAYANKIDAKRILDYGCGQGTLRVMLKRLNFQTDILEYDPAIPGKDMLPKPADLVITTDVLEHIEPDKLDKVLEHIYTLTKKAAFILVATRPANKTLPDGRNAHLIQKDAGWWKSKVEQVGFRIDQFEVKSGHDVKFWCSK